MYDALYSYKGGGELNPQYGGGDALAISPTAGGIGIVGDVNFGQPMTGSEDISQYLPSDANDNTAIGSINIPV